MALFAALFASAMLAQIVAMVFAKKLQNYVRTAHPDTESELNTGSPLRNIFGFEAYVWSNRDEVDPIVSSLKKRLRVTYALVMILTFLAFVSFVIAMPS